MELAFPSDISALIKSPGWKQRTKSLQKKLAGVSSLFKSKSHSSPDELFFSVEDLPYLGKEYWFLYFSDPASDLQAILTLGRSAEPVKVNRSSVLGCKSKGKRHIDCAAVCWLYSGKKRVLFDSVASVRIHRGKIENSLIASSEGNEASIRGDYPDFDIRLSKKGKVVFFARACFPKEGIPYEMINLLKNPLVSKLSSAMINYYFDFNGKMSGKNVSGKAYLQKVVAVMPLAPWNWVRINFSRGACLDFFSGKPLGSVPAIHFADNAYFEEDGVRTKISGDIKLTSFMDGESRIWLLSGNGFFLSMRTYALQPFVMKQRTTFRYNEYLVRVTDFAFKTKDKEHSLLSLGEGRGIVEEASGYLI